MFASVVYLTIYYQSLFIILFIFINMIFLVIPTHIKQADGIYFYLQHEKAPLFKDKGSLII